MIIMDIEQPDVRRKVKDISVITESHTMTMKEFDVAIERAKLAMQALNEATATFKYKDLELDKDD